MKILQINNCHYHRGGADIVYFNTSELLKAKGHEVFNFSFKGENMISNEYSNYFPEEIDHRASSIFKKTLSIKEFIYNKKAANNLIQLLEKIRPDIAHIHLFMGGLSSSILDVLNAKKIPVIHTVHDYRLICPAYLFFNNKNKICEVCKKNRYYNCIINKCSEGKVFQSTVLALDSYFRFFTKKIQNKIDHYVFVSSFAKKKHLEFLLDKESKMDVLHNFVPGLNKVKTNNEKGDYFLYYGRLSREKGIETLIKSFEEKDIRLKIIGTGPLFDYYNERHYKNIEFLGYKSGDVLNELVRNSSFVIVPSEWYENNPMTIIEAYSFGKPVIGAKIGGIPEIIEPGKTGFLFSSGDVEDLVSCITKAEAISNEEYYQLSQNSRLFADNNFNPKLHYKNLIKIYNKIIFHY